MCSNPAWASSRCWWKRLSQAGTGRMAPARKSFLQTWRFKQKFLPWRALNEFQIFAGAEGRWEYRTAREWQRKPALSWAPTSLRLRGRPTHTKSLIPILTKPGSSRQSATRPPTSRLYSVGEKHLVESAALRSLLLWCCSRVEGDSTFQCIARSLPPLIAKICGRKAIIRWFMSYMTKRSSNWPQNYNRYSNDSISQKHSDWKHAN